MNIISYKEKLKNVDDILDIMKNSYYQYYNRAQDIHTKSGFFIAFHSAIILLVVNPEKINNMMTTRIETIGMMLKYFSILNLTLIILILAIVSICLFICSLKSRDIKYMPATICSDKYYNCINYHLKKQLLSSYREIAAHNESIISKKHNLYNIASILTLIEVIFIGINLILQMI